MTGHRADDRLVDWPDAPCERLELQRKIAITITYNWKRLEKSKKSHESKRTSCGWNRWKLDELTYERSSTEQVNCVCCRTQRRRVASKTYRAIDENVANRSWKENRSHTLSPLTHTPHTQAHRNTPVLWIPILMPEDRRPTSAYYTST